MRVSAVTIAILGVLLGVICLFAEPLNAAARKTPYWASIGAKAARMRTGPARAYPANWLYQRADLPVRVTAVMREWRRVEDPNGTSGWMQGTLLRDTRTAIVRGTQPVELRDRPSPAGRLLWRAAPGVVGRISACGGGWCRMDVHGQAGFVEIAGLWGIEPGEVVP